MSKFKEIMLAVAIVVVLNMFFNYGVSTFYKSPDYEKACPTELMQNKYENKDACEAVGGKWFEGSTAVYQGEYNVPVPAGDKSSNTSWCDATAKCREEFQNAQNFYNRNVFIILEIAGLIAFLLGLFAINAKAVSNGFLGGGVLSLIIGTVRYWSGMDDYLRFGILGIALAILIWVGYKKIRS